MHGFLYKHMGKLQRAITSMSSFLRHESKFFQVKPLVSTHSACPCKNYPPKCSQTPHELDYLIINPRRMREGYCSWFVCLSVCLSVCYHASCYIPRLRVQFAVLQGSLWRSQFMICVDFSENALFASFGVICRF